MACLVTKIVCGIKKPTCGRLGFVEGVRRVTNLSAMIATQHIAVMLGS